MSDERHSPKTSDLTDDVAGDGDEPRSGHPLKADQQEPAGRTGRGEPFAGDDDILSGHLGTDAEPK